MRNSPKNCDRQPLDYVDRVNRAIDFILRHLAEPLRLEAVARAACFSPYHFHRVFRLLVGESLGDFIKRLRLERALTLMSQKDGATRRATVADRHRFCLRLRLFVGFHALLQGTLWRVS